MGIQIFDNTLSAIRKSLTEGWYPFIRCKNPSDERGDVLPEVGEDIVCPASFFHVDDRLQEINVNVVMRKDGAGKSSDYVPCTHYPLNKGVIRVCNKRWMLIM